MLEPRESDIPVLLLFFVLFPLFAYILLGKWSETSIKKEMIDHLALLAAEEASKAETMTASEVIPVSPSPKNIGHLCAKCSAPATTRCSQCRSVRYCSGKCQIIHWRQVHKDECVQLGKKSLDDSISNEVLENGNLSPQSFLDGHKNQMNEIPFSSDDRIHQSSGSVTSAEAGFSDTSKIPTMERRSKDKRGSRRSNFRGEDGVILDCSEETAKNRVFSVMTLDELSQKGNHGEPGVDTSSDFGHGHGVFRTTRQESHLESLNINEEPAENITTRSNKAKSSSCSLGTKTHVSEMDVKRHDSNDPKVRQKETVRGSSMGIMKMIGMMKSSKLNKPETQEVSCEKNKKLKTLFPYEEFVKFFQYEIIDLSPRGLVNCGNSCYANAVLQCLMSTKPLTVYLLERAHSRYCCVRNWCLMCELEEHVTMSRQSRGPLSPSRILSQMQNSNCQIGNGSQEDAHEFLRFLITSMQSICLEGVGGEDAVDPKLQETTFIQYAFGGRLKSKVKCLRCFHESERYENIMDLTLEIYGWVESLEDALTQFTTPEELDGDNMYRCGKCSAYVRARKQLKIHEAPNILTIVLKRFQEGSYGKINKWITFPDMLDMIPYMTGEDSPPLYSLYGVIVHVDTLNASFSGHYVSYVKDLLGNWFRVDDTEVQSVQSSQVMSEGAYILFYKRSCPRPTKSFTDRNQNSGFIKHFSSKNVKPSSKSKNENHQPETNFTNAKPFSMELSDITSSSDWSMFTSSDDSSIATESNRDSFSTDSSFSSIFENLYGPENSSNRMIKCNMFSGSKPLTRFAPDRTSFMGGSSYYLKGEENAMEGTFPSSDGNYCSSVYYYNQTSSYW